MVQLGMASGNVKTAEVRKWHLVRWIFLVADAQKWPLGRNEVTQNDTLMVRNYLIYKRMTFLKQNHAKNRKSGEAILCGASPDIHRLSNRWCLTTSEKY
jgi:hypothetical protein